ncbi:hypothetical protein [Streptomyces sp. NPDC047718]|uniref:hypothetical protein n=1 Tax=Streptomyces sp. NPDC047718 TaxID=3155479 RepID=UPI00340B7B91
MTSQLKSNDTVLVLSAAWDALTLAARVSHSITFDEGSDELQGLFASQRCMEARDRLPLPSVGEPISTPVVAEGAAGLDPYVRLLQVVQESLTRLADTADADEEDARRSLELTSQLAAGAATALAAVRER